MDSTSTKVDSETGEVTHNFAPAEVSAAEPTEPTEFKASQKTVGFTDFVLKEIPDPQDVITNVLVPGEVIIDTFQVYMPELYIPLYKRVFYCIITLGLYLFVLLERWCQRNRACGGCCIPKEMFMTRGIMSITSKGRAICQGIKVYQKLATNPYVAMMMDCMNCCCWWNPLICIWAFIRKCCCAKLCEPPQLFELSNRMQIYHLRDVCQVTTSFESKVCCSLFSFCGNSCGCLEYESGVRLNFNTFDEDTNGSSPVKVENRKSWISKWSQKLSPPADVFNQFDTSLTPNQYVEIISTQEDKECQGDAKVPFKATTSIHHKVISLISSFAPDVFMSQPSTDMVAGGRTPQADIMTDKTSVQIVDDTMHVKMPREILQLMPNEYVIDSMGLMMKMFFWDYVSCIVTLGLSYLCYYRKKKYDRTAIVLTNKRLFVVDIYHRAAVTPPPHFTNFQYTARSLLLSEVTAGAMYKSSYIDMWMMLFSYCVYPFQSCCYTGSPENFFVDLLSPAGAVNVQGILEQHLGFAKSLGQTYSKRNALPEHIINAAKQYLNGQPNKEEKRLLPFGTQETVLGRHIQLEDDTYKKNYQNCCLLKESWWVKFCPCRETLEGQYCGKDTCSKYCWPLPQLFCTCGVRPRQVLDDYIISDTALYCVREVFTHPLIPCLYDEYDFECVWIPIQSLSNITIDTEMNGFETWWRRLWQYCRCTLVNWCCPMAESIARINVSSTTLRTDTVHLPLRLRLKEGLTLSQDKRIPETLKALATIRQGLDDCEYADTPVATAQVLHSRPLKGESASAPGGVEVEMVKTMER